MEDGRSLGGTTAAPSAPAMVRARAAAAIGTPALGLVFVGALAALWIAAGPHEITKTDEHRYVTVAREMVAAGDWLVCRLNGVTYTHKPPGWFWVTALSHVLGASWTTAAKVASVLGGAASVTLLSDLARRLHGRVAAYAAAVALLTTKEWLTISMRGQLDPFVGLWTTLATYSFARAVLFGAAPRARTAWTAAGFLAAGCGMMVKGPVAFAIPGAAALVALLWSDEWAAVRWWRWGLGLLALVAPLSFWGLGWVPGPVAIAVRLLAFGALTSFGSSRWRALATWRWALALLAFLPGVVWAVAAAARAPEGWGYVQALAFGQGVEHAAGHVDKLEPWWFYAKSFPVGLLPWTLLLPAAVWAWRRTGDPPLVRRFEMAWLVAPLVVMSLSLGKRDLYLVPVYPASALLLGRLAAAAAEDPATLVEPLVRWGVRAFAAVGVVAGLGVGALGVLRLAGADAVLARHSEDWAAAQRTLPGHVGPAMAALGAGLVVASLAILRARTPGAAGRAFAAGAALLVVLAGAVYAPFTSAASSPRPFLEQVRARIGDAPLGDYGGSDFAANWICGREVVPILEGREHAEQFLSRHDGPAFLCVDRERLAERGTPDGMRVVLEDPRPVPWALVLLGRE